ncbi:MAG: hypothetical protein KJO29_05020 [Bacteroidia bacterium]|nr:hypothetical protein [Bacteroidia bacterium]
MLDSCLLPEADTKDIIVFDDKSYALDQLARLCIWLVYLRKIPVCIHIANKEMFHDILHHLDLLDIAFLTGKGGAVQLMTDRFTKMMLQKQESGLAELKRKLTGIQHFKNGKPIDPKISVEVFAVQHLLEDLIDKDEFYSKNGFHFILNNAINEPFHELISIKTAATGKDNVEYDDYKAHIYIEDIPDKGIEEECYVIGYTDRFRRHAERFSSSNQAGLQINPSLLIRSSYPRNESDYLSLNQKSVYFGKVLHDVNASCRIYELKYLSVISFLSKTSNETIVPLIEGENAKEISLISAAENLLPGVLSYTSKRVVILLEEGIIDPGQATNLLDQLRLIKKLGLSGIQCLSLFQYDIMKAGKEAFYDIVRRISAFNQP